MSSRPQKLQAAQNNAKLVLYQWTNWDYGSWATHSCAPIIASSIPSKIKLVLPQRSTSKGKFPRWFLIDIIFNSQDLQTAGGWRDHQGTPSWSLLTSDRQIMLVRFYSMFLPWRKSMRNNLWYILPRKLITRYHARETFFTHLTFFYPRRLWNSYSKWVRGNGEK